MLEAIDYLPHNPSNFHLAEKAKQLIRAVTHCAAYSAAPLVLVLASTACNDASSSTSAQPDYHYWRPVTSTCEQDFKNGKPTNSCRNPITFNPFPCDFTPTACPDYDPHFP